MEDFSYLCAKTDNDEKNLVFFTYAAGGSMGRGHSLK